MRSVDPVDAHLQIQIDDTIHRSVDQRPRPTAPSNTSSGPRRTSVGPMSTYAPEHALGELS